VSPPEWEIKEDVVPSHPGKIWSPTLSRFDFLVQVRDAKYLVIRVSSVEFRILSSEQRVVQLEGAELDRVRQVFAILLAGKEPCCAFGELGQSAPAGASSERWLSAFYSDRPIGAAARK
jgi:hypothetical protein